MTDILRARMLSRFACLGDKCEDTCCQNWSMQVDAATIERYKKDAPELLEVVTPSAEAPWIMRKDLASGMCVKLEGGLCGIHKKYGEKFLGDACYFYPRVTRKLEGQIVMTAALSCPEMARLALAEDQSGALETVSVDRLPSEMKTYSSGVSESDALATHRAFLAATEDKQASPERIFLRIASASRSLARVDKKTWPQAAPFYLAHADARIPEAELSASDPFNLLHAFAGLVVASHKKPSERLWRTIQDMEKALAVRLDWERTEIILTPESPSAYARARETWEKKYAAPLAPMLRRWLQAQLSLALYPYAGLGNDLIERVTIIGVRFATLKLALMSGCAIAEIALPQEEAIRIIQSLSRFLDHLGDAGFSLKIYAETGWTREERMRGLLDLS